VMEQTETKPPHRYNQGSLIQEMDRLQLGTKSTRHEIIGKLFSRNYVEGNNLIPTETGTALTKSLEKHGGGITEPEMTSKLELDMIDISEGKNTLTEVVKHSQNMLYEVAKKISSQREQFGADIRSALKSEQVIGICPTCGSNMSFKKSKNGKFIGCDGFPECARAYPLPRGAMIQTTETICPECGLAQLKIIRKGVPPSIQCIDPKCRSNTDKNNLGKCPTCKDGIIRITFSKAGKRFAGCSDWPKCTQTYPLRPRGTIQPTDENCTICGSPIIVFNGHNECINSDCGTTGSKPVAAPVKKTGGKTAGKTSVKKKSTSAKKIEIENDAV